MSLPALLADLLSHFQCYTQVDPVVFNHGSTSPGWVGEHLETHGGIPLAFRLAGWGTLTGIHSWKPGILNILQGTPA